jgi:hypothetical protein
VTTELPIPSGPTNKEIIDRAYQVLGLSDSMFGRTPEEYASAMLPLGGMMLEWPFDQLGYWFEETPGGRVEEESGISRKYLDTVAHSLAERVGPTIGKSLSPEASKVKNVLYSRLCADVRVATPAQYAAATPTGAGARRYAGTYFPPAE